jgi:hypothetical protein
VIHELRTYTIKTEYGGVRELERRFGNGIDVRLKYSALGGFFHTLSGNMSQVVHIWPYKDLRDRAESRAAANRDESNRWPPGIAELFERQEVEILIPAPFMPELAPRELGRLWVLGWHDYKPVEAPGALEALRDALPAFDKQAPVVGAWTVDAGPSLGRIYTLTAFRDRAHLDAAQAAWASEPPPPMPAPLSRGVKLLEPSQFSTLR